MIHRVFAAALLTAALMFSGCNKSSEPAPKTDEEKTATSAEDKAPAKAEAPAIKTDVGVDLATKTIRIGTLNDESGPAAVIGKPYAVGKRILAAQINAGDSKLLPEGWKIELVERDHGYNPQASVQAFKELEKQEDFKIGPVRDTECLRILLPC